MLALARNEGQSIIIDGTIEVKVVKWSRSSVRLAIQAPREVRVDRDETWRKMNPGKMTPLEVAEKERNERFAREGESGTGAPSAKRTPAEGEIAITAPAAGVFHRPEGDAAVRVGDAVEATTIVGHIISDEDTIPIPAGTAGILTRVLVNSGQTVAAGDALLLVKT